jgi:hypothetical protein
MNSTVSSEYLAEWRIDSEAFVTLEAIEACRVVFLSVRHWLTRVISGLWIRVVVRLTR